MSVARTGPPVRRRPARVVAWAVAAVVALVVAGTGCGRLAGRSAAQAGEDPGGDAVAVGAATAEAPAGGRHQGVLVHDGRERTYEVFVPENLAPGALLVVGLHGGFGNGGHFAAVTGFDAVAAREGFVAVYPDGALLRAPGLGRDIRTWNGGRCCGPAAREQVDDVGFVVALVDDLVGRYGLDPAQVFVTGHSNGAILAFRLACEQPGRFAAVAPVAGSWETDRCAPDATTSVLAVHGDADANHPIDGGFGSGVAGVPFRSLAESVDAVRSAFGCARAGPPVVDGPVSTTSWPGCRDGVVVEQVVVAGAEHPWPGSDPRRSGLLDGFSGEPSQDLDATEAVWAFFDRVG